METLSGESERLHPSKGWLWSHPIRWPEAALTALGLRLEVKEERLEVKEERR